MVPFVGYREEGFIGFNDTVQHNILCHELQCVQDFMTPRKSGVVMDAADCRTFTERIPVHHAVNILFPNIYALMGAGDNGVRRYEERLSAITADIALFVAESTIADNVCSAAERANGAGFETLVLDASLHVNEIAEMPNNRCLNSVLVGSRQTVICR